MFGTLARRLGAQRTQSVRVGRALSAWSSRGFASRRRRSDHIGDRFPTVINSVVNFLPSGYEFPCEVMGKYTSVLQPGLNLNLPFITKIHAVDMRELCLEIPKEKAYTKDNVEVTLSGNLFLQFYDSIKAVYGASRPLYAARQFAQGIMRTQVGRKELDELFASRSEINTAVVEEMEEGAAEWGCRVLRFEITDLEPCDTEVRKSLHKQATALREKKETVLQSEAHLQRVENESKAELYRVRQEADAKLYMAQQTAESEKRLLEARGAGEANRIRQIARSIKEAGGESVVKMVLSQEYIQKFGELAKSSTVTLLPADVGDVAKMVAVGSKVFNQSGDEAHTSGASSSQK